MRLVSVTDLFEYFLLESISNGMKHKTVKNYRSILASFVKCNGDIPMSLVDEDIILRWKLYMDERGNSKSSISSSLSKLRMVVKFSAKKGIKVMDYEDISLPKFQNKTPVFLDYTEVQKLIDTAPNPREKAIIACLFSTGCRIAELLNINRDDIHDFEVAIIGKGDKPRTVYLDATAMGYLQDYLDTRRDNLRPLFISAQRSRITVSRVQQQLHEIADWAGIDKRVTPHVLRHTYATDLHRNGAPLLVIKELLGHEKISSTVIYTHITSPEKKEVYNRYHSAEPKH